MLGGILSGLFGVALVALGLLFLVGSGGRSYRYLIAVSCMALGALLAGVGVLLFKRARSESPDQIEAQILQLAKREDGEIALAELVAVFGTRFGSATPVLQRLESSGVCQRRSQDGQPYFIFPQLQQRLIVLRCNFCRAELPLNEKIEQCPQCGGTVSSHKEAVAASDASYSMD